MSIVGIVNRLDRLESTDRLDLPVRRRFNRLEFHSRFDRLTRSRRIARVDRIARLDRFDFIQCIDRIMRLDHLNTTFAS